MFMLNLVIASDTLSPGQSIKDGERLVSSGQSFELGFFSPENSKYRYLGIWYKFSPEKVVWIANRNNPLTDSNGALTFSDEGNLVVLNRSKSIIWSSNSSMVLRNPVAQLLDSGNLVSFDYPSDTQLAGMRMGWNLKSGFEGRLTSCKSTDDPSSGDYTNGINVNGLPHFEMFNRGSTKTFRTGPWNGFRFMGAPATESAPFKSLFVYNETDVYCEFDNPVEVIITIFALNHSGVIQRLQRKKESSTWDVMMTYPRDPCDNYGQCVANSVCKSNKDPRCQCLQGFVPKSQEEWKLFNSTSGCIRKAQLNCFQEPGFLKISMLNRPDPIDFWVECLKNCSCTAYANSDVRGGGSGCLMWFGDLIDIREFEQDNHVQNIYIKLSAYEVMLKNDPILERSRLHQT
ncbi:hypothetical protein EUGRSUZ_F01046 [Eucalyptus grandis]|uniref:non-specific serine/threonine protein kinase n=2 Tax=Eucalyptus grandis TaxID=71139 RepID=A0A059BLZ9_EUCGR|nr:hypothetical protein EUGRSUZ_F01046 [Eucalyptus grandis]